MKSLILRCFLPLAIPLFLLSCAFENEEEVFGLQACDPQEVTYKAVIKPIIEAKCTLGDCHNGSNRNLRNYYIYGIVQAQARFIKQNTTTQVMPPSNSGVTLTADEINKIACWVDSGAQNN